MITQPVNIEVERMGETAVVSVMCNTCKFQIVSGFMSSEIVDQVTTPEFWWTRPGQGHQYPGLAHPHTLKECRMLEKEYQERMAARKA